MATSAGAITWPLRSIPARDRPAKPHRPLPQRIGAFAVSLPDHPWLDRLVRGRGWIPVLGVLLAGIVATQVEILKYGANMGRAIEQTTTLTSQNEQLRDSVATLSNDQRIERLASAMGMVLPPPGAVGYLDAAPGSDVSGALGNVHSPDPSSFVALTPRDGDGAMVTGPGTSTLPPPPGAAPTVTTPSANADSSTTSSSATTAGSQSSTTASQTTQATTTDTQGLTTAAQTPTVTSTTPTQATTGGSQTPTDAGSTAPTDQSVPASSTGAAAIQPSNSSQQSAGGYQAPG